MLCVREEARKWLEQSIEDLNTAKDTLSTGHYYAVAFWSHQAAEKALNALLIDGGKAVGTHDLNELLNVIHDELNIPINDVLSDVNKLTVHYTISRYPDAANGVPARLYSKSYAEELLSSAQRVVEWVRRNLQ